MHSSGDDEIWQCRMKVELWEVKVYNDLTHTGLYSTELVCIELGLWERTFEAS